MDPSTARPPCPSPTPRVYSNSCPLSRWCLPTVSSCRPLLPPSIFPSIRVFSNESVFCISWPKSYQSLLHTSFRKHFKTLNQKPKHFPVHSKLLSKSSGGPMCWKPSCYYDNCLLWSFSITKCRQQSSWDFVAAFYLRTTGLRCWKGLSWSNPLILHQGPRRTKLARLHPTPTCQFLHGGLAISLMPFGTAACIFILFFTRREWSALVPCCRPTQAKLN